MAAPLLSLHLLCYILVGATAVPMPGRVPKVYNALITSNQNLEPSKAYPVYQPVLHDAFAFPFQPAVFYGGDFINHGIFPVPALPPKEPQPSQPIPASTPTPEEPTPSSTENPPSTPEPAPESNSISTTPAPPLPPNTQPPIPLNQFGLPPQVIPLDRIDPAYEGFSQVGPFTYTYPGLRFYDPYDPFSLSPYAHISPVYRPLANVLGQNAPVFTSKEAPVASPGPSAEQPAQTPPSEPSDLNVLNYSSKDPAIPNVPPPPLPQGGLKSDKNE